MKYANQENHPCVATGAPAFIPICCDGATSLSQLWAAELTVMLLPPWDQGPSGRLNPRTWVIFRRPSIRSVTLLRNMKSWSLAGAPQIIGMNWIWDWERVAKAGKAAPCSCSTMLSRCWVVPKSGHLAGTRRTARTRDHVWKIVSKLLE
jgi:hypothetical protein